MNRTMCGDIRGNVVDQEVLVKGWVKRRRKLGHLIFLDVADRSGRVQVVVPEDRPCFEAAKRVTRESVVEIAGKVVVRTNPNPDLPTGMWEIWATTVQIDSLADVPPMLVEDETDALEEVRMRYRYLDLRRPMNQQLFMLRAEVLATMTEYLRASGFTNVETPILGKPTPEGARDYLVPSRLNPGEFYALPQSPQLYKQLLMVAGFERYFQVARCFRDEDLRSDRQPEFTQLDMELSFTNEFEIQEIVEHMLHKVFHTIFHADIAIPFPRLSYADAMNRYGSDKPDLRYGVEIQDVTDLFGETTFQAFQGAERVKLILAPQQFDRKAHQQFLKVAQDFGAPGLGWIAWDDGQLVGTLKNALTAEELEALRKRFGPDGTFFFAAGSNDFVNTVLGAVRVEVGKFLALGQQFKFVWIVDWPLFEWSEGRWVAAHHPFTAPKDPETFDLDPAHAHARAYDIVLNGVEIGGGSIRITDPHIQDRMFHTIGLDALEIQEKFGFLLEAFRYGVPPHGGLAIGIDRLIELMFNRESIKDCIAFPKNNQAIDPMMGAPTHVDQDALDILDITVKTPGVEGDKNKK